MAVYRYHKGMVVESGGPGEGPATSSARQVIVGSLDVKARPVAKGRPRMSKSGHVYTPNRTRAYEDMIRKEWIKQNPNLLPFTTPVKVFMDFYFQRPKAHYVGMNRERGVIKDGMPIFYTHTPDLDNIEKSVLDALNKIAYVDDKLIVQKYSNKLWYHENLVRVRMEAM